MNIRFYPFANFLNASSVEWVGYVLFPEQRPALVALNYRPVFRITIPLTDGSRRVVRVWRQSWQVIVARDYQAEVSSAVDLLRDEVPVLLKEALLILHPDLAERLLPGIQFIEVNGK